MNQDTRFFIEDVKKFNIENVLDWLSDHRDIDVNTRFNGIFYTTPLHWWMCQKSSKNHINLLLRKGADPALTDYKGRTPLHYALDIGQKENASTLLEKMTKSQFDEVVEKKDHEGRTAAQIAKENNIDGGIFGSCNDLEKDDK